MKRRAFLLISVGLLCIPSVVRAARMGLLEAERVALENSPDLRLLRLETAALSEAQSARIRDFFPQVSVSYRQNRVVALRDYDNGQYSTQIQISQPVYDGGRSSLAYELAGYDVRLARERARKLRGSLRLQVRKAFFKVQQTSVQVSVSEASLESASALLQKSRVERTRGLATELDLREIDNEQKRRYAQLKKDQAARADAAEDLHHLLRLPDGSVVFCEMDLSGILIKETALSEDLLLELALQNSPDVRESRIDQVKALKQEAVTESDYLPVVSITGHYGKSGERWPPRTTEWGVGFNVSFAAFGSTVKTDGSVNRSRGETSRGLSDGGSLDLFSNAAWREQRLRAALSALSAKQKGTDLVRELQVQVKRLIRDFRDQGQNLSLTDEQTAVLEQRFLVDKKRYEFGELSLHDLLTQEVKLIQARQSLVNERIAYALSASGIESSLGLELDELGLVEFRESDGDSAADIRKSWTPKTIISVPRADGGTH